MPGRDKELSALVIRVELLLRALYSFKNYEQKYYSTVIIIDTKGIKNCNLLGFSYQTQTPCPAKETMKKICISKDWGKIEFHKFPDILPF